MYTEILHVVYLQSRLTFKILFLLIFCELKGEGSRLNLWFYNPWYFELERIGQAFSK